MILITYLATLSVCFLLLFLLLFIGVIKYNGNDFLEAILGISIISFILSIPSFIIVLLVKLL